VILADQPCDLRHAQAAHLAEQGTHLSTLFLALREVLLLHQGRRNPVVNLFPALPGKLYFRAAPEETIDLLGRQSFHVRH
jgi:hypothetical protein